MGSMATFQAFKFTMTFLFGALFIGAIIGIALASPECQGQDKCQSEKKYKFSEHQTVVGERIHLYESNIFTPIERCYIKSENLKWRGEVTNGIVNPTQGDLDRLGFPECVIPKPADNSLSLREFAEMLGILFGIAIPATIVILGVVMLLEKRDKKRRASA